LAAQQQRPAANRPAAKQAAPAAQSKQEAPKLDKNAQRKQELEALGL
jgi:hypothetical protein